MTPHDMYKWRNYCPWSVQLRPASSACELRAEVSPPSCTAGWEWHMFRVCLGKKNDNASIREPELGKARVIVITIAVKSSPRGPIRWYDFCNGLKCICMNTNAVNWNDILWYVHWSWRAGLHNKLRIYKFPNAITWPQISNKLPRFTAKFSCSSCCIQPLHAELYIYIFIHQIQEVACWDSNWLCLYLRFW